MSKQSPNRLHYHFTDRLTADDVKRHLHHPFEIPSGCRQISIRFNFTPAAIDDIKNLLTLTLFDPAGFRGAGHRGGNTHVVAIKADQATPGYIPGPLPEGEWRVQIDTHMILPGEACHYQVEITIETADNGPEASTRPVRKPTFSFVANPAPGWYRGDLHAHTVHSDAGWDVAALVAEAHRYNLDFVTLTDHNTVSGLAEIEGYATHDLLTLGGIELTTFWGHAVCLGSHEWIDWRVTQDGPEMAAIANQVYEAGQLFIIAHPKDIGDPYCTGCRWVYPGLMPGPARFVEVWNGLWRGRNPLNHEKNEAGLALWYEWLNEGRRLVATAGSDAHGPAPAGQAPGFNVIYAETLSEQGILQALTAGRLYLSAGPSLTFTGQIANEKPVMMGDALSLTQGADTVTLQATWDDCPPTTALRLIAGGDVFATRPVSGRGDQTWTAPVNQAGWYLLELRAQDNTLLALTNPIFIG